MKMKKLKIFLEWKIMSVSEMVDSFGSLGFQAIELSEAVKVALKMKRTNAKIFLTFTQIL
jgi:deoxyhypusine synthase